MKRFYWLAVLAAVVLVGPGMRAQTGDELDKNYATLKQAEESKDAAQVKKLAVDTFEMARKAEAQPAPEDEEGKQLWKQRVEYIKSIEVHCEYALSAAAVQAQPAEAIDLVDTLQGLNPKSKYLNDAWGSYMVAMTKTGAAAKVPEMAAKALVNFPENEDLLMVLADHSLVSNQTDKAYNYATRLVTALTKHPKPERAAALARGHWIVGVISGDRGKWVDTDKHLRAALPNIKDIPAMNGPALFFLGLANFQLGKMTLNKAKMVEGAKFSEQAAAIPGPYAQQAWKNAALMKTEASNVR